MKVATRDDQAGEVTSTTESSVSERAVIALVCVCVFTSVLNTNMFNVALPQIGRDFNLTAGSLGWVVTSYSLVFGIGTPFYGRLADMYGLRRMFMIGLTIFATGSFLAALALNYPMLIAARVVQAAGTAAIPALGTAAVFRVIPPERRGTASGYIAAIVGVGAAIGPSLGGGLVQFASWRALFFFGALLIIAVPLARRILPAFEPNRKMSLDLPGGILLGMMVAALLLAVTNVENFGLMSSMVTIPAFVSVTAGVLLSFRIRHTDEPFVPADLLKNRNYRTLVFIGFAMLLTHMGTLVTVPLLLDQVNGMSPGRIGLVMLPSAVMLSIAGPISGRLTDRIGAQLPMRAGIATSLLSILLLSSFGVGASGTVVAGILLLSGLGMGMANSPMINSVSLVVPTARSGLALSLFHMNFFLGGAFGAAVITSIIDARDGATSSLNFLHSGGGVPFSDAFLVPLGMSVLALILSMTLEIPKPWELRTRQRTVDEDREDQSGDQ